MKILICGLPGSGKSTLAEPFTKAIGGIWLNADAVRTKYDDWDFSYFGRARQAKRMSLLADGVIMAGKVAVCDFVCPKQSIREEFAADFTVFMDTIETSEYEDTNQMFEAPTDMNYHVSKWFDDTHENLVKVIERFNNVQL